MLANDTPPDFQSLGLSEPVLRALQDIGYETPSPIQAMAIPEILTGRDLLGQAQTGTGKTAAFALPILSNIDLAQRDPQVLVLAPTRELAIQVAEAFQRYAHHMPGFHVLPIYGGQSYDTQLRQLKRGVHVVVGTPGRVMDHLRRHTLDLSGLKTLVLDEADEMLRMGFIDDVEWIMEQIPKTRQIALFSATMPREIKKVVDTYLQDPAEITIASKTSTASTIRQRYWFVSGLHKLDALTRILESENFEAVLIFVRTKNSTADLAERLNARGYAAEALNGDVAQAQRERIVERLKKGSLDVVVATDVAARGLDVERISHVINFDIPHDVESYVHRIGRTGRAGRSGEAILFVSHREKRLLRAIEQTTRQPIEEMAMPTIRDINIQRVERFKARIGETLSDQDLDFFLKLVSDYQTEHDTDPQMIAAALAHMSQGTEPLLLPQQETPSPRQYAQRDESERGEPRRDRQPRTFDDAAPARRPRERSEGEAPRRPRESTSADAPRSFRERRHESDAPRSFKDREDSRPRRTEFAAGSERRDFNKEGSDRAKPLRTSPDIEMERFRIDVGRAHNVTPTNIVGCIANEADIDSQFIGHIEIHDTYSTVDLPAGMPKPMQQTLRKAWVCGQKLNLRSLTAPASPFGNDELSEPKNRPAPRQERSVEPVKKKLGLKKPASGSTRTEPRKKIRERDVRNKGKPKKD